MITSMIRPYRSINALAETVNGLFTAELNTVLCSHLGDIPPAEYECIHCRETTPIMRCESNNASLRQTRDA
jgi:hypothetical protein